VGLEIIPEQGSSDSPTPMARVQDAFFADFGLYPTDRSDGEFNYIFKIGDSITKLTNK